MSNKEIIELISAGVTLLMLGVRLYFYIVMIGLASHIINNGVQLNVPQEIRDREYNQDVQPRFSHRRDF